MSQNQEIIESKLCAYIDGELDPEGRAEIEKHLEANPQHRRLLESLKATRDLLRWLPREPAPPELAESLNGQLERSVLLDYDGESLRPRIVPRVLAAAAIVILTAGLAAAVYFALPKSRRNATPIAMNTGTEQLKQADSAGSPGPTAAARDTEREGEAPYLGKAGAAPMRGVQASESADQAKPEADPELEHIAREVAANSDTIVAAANGLSNAATDTAPPAMSNAVVMLVRADKPDAAQKELTDYLTTNQIQWRPADLSQGAQGTGGQERELTMRSANTLSDVAAEQPAQRQFVEARADRAATTQPAAQTPVAGQPNLAVSQPIPGPEQGIASRGIANAQIGRNARSNNLFVARMSRSQAEALSTVMNRQGQQEAQVQDVPPGVSRLSVNASLEEGLSGAASTQPASEGRYASANSPRRAMLSKAGDQQLRPTMAPTTRPTGDVIEIGEELRVLVSNDFSFKKASPTESGQTVRVAPDGTVNLPTIGAFRCAGLTADQANQAIAKTIADKSPTKFGSKDASVASAGLKIERVSAQQMQRPADTQSLAGIAQSAQAPSAATTAPSDEARSADEPLNVVIVVEPTAQPPAGAVPPATEPVNPGSTQPARSDR